MNTRSGEQSRLNILEAARSVFSQHGYAQASMRAIAQEAGISVGGLYIYFKNKEDLYLTFMQHAMKNLNDTTQDALLMIENPVEAVQTFIVIAIDFAKTHREVIALQGRELGLSFGSDFTKNFARERRNRIAEIIRKGKDAGHFNECDADDAAKVILNLLRGYVVSMLTDEDSLFTPEEGVNLVLHGLLRRNGG